MNKDYIMYTNKYTTICKYVKLSKHFIEIQLTYKEYLTIYMNMGCLPFKLEKKLVKETAYTQVKQV